MKEAGKLEKIALTLTKGIGSPMSLVVHTILFLGAFVLGFFGVNWDKILLVLTTIVSLEAIYLAIFIQITVNRSAESLEEVEKDVEEIQKDVDEIQEDVDEIQKDVDEIQEDVDEIQEDVDEISQEEIDSNKRELTLNVIQEDLKKLIADVEKLKK